MNLADIRKKAQQEQERSSSTSNEPVSAATESPAIAAESETPAAIVTQQRQVNRETAAVTGRIDAEEQRPFDPLQALLAGRELVVEDREGIAENAKLLQREAANFVEFLCFRVASERYAITIMEIKEIIKPREITEVPRVPEFVTGVLSLRGVIIPVFDMVKRLGLAALPQSGGKERIIVVKKGDEFCGVLVDEVIQVVRIEASSIEPPPAVLDGIDREFVSGIGRNESQMLILLNMDKILDVTLC